jgi:3-oxosteroid 1-dehydrogenase
LALSGFRTRPQVVEENRPAIHPAAMAAAPFDVIVLGSGIAGLSAALAAARMGLKPLVLEKAGQIGGITVHSYGIIWVGCNHLAQAAGLADDRNDVIAYMRFIGGGQVAEDKMLAFVDRAPQALRFFEECGIAFRIIGGLTDHYFGTAPGSRGAGRSLETGLIAGGELGPWRARVLAPDAPAFVTLEEQVRWGGINAFSRWDQALVAERKSRDLCGKGLGLVVHFLKALLAHDVPIRTGQSVERLLMEDGRVAGVVMASGEALAARRGVVIATGGYHANPELAREYEGLPGMLQEPSSLAPPSITGDGLVLAGEIGAVIRKVENNLKLQLAYTIPPEEPGALPTCVHAGIVELCSPHTLVVNRAGQRFADETFFQGMVPRLRDYDAARREYRNLPAFLIFDSQYPERYSFANRAAGSSVPASVPRAQSFAALARALGIDAKGLEATVKRFNAFADQGIDADFHRGETQWRLAGGGKPGNASLGRLERPPFYGVRLHPTNSNSTGLLTGPHGEVMHQRRRPIPGLYASGYAAAPTESGIGYQAGTLIAASMTFSYLAVRHMLGLS